uniref:E3 ubiquitin-protein ligase n=2 Tax=Brassica oleracea TaxID=3712 RepID=A0A0D3CT48_BRAOL|nr:unnamed protein product [Brassica oleracea]
MACSSCCSKLRDICPTCASPIGHIRCRGMETVIESVFLPCINAELGCAEKVSFLKESTHKKESSFSLCSCPVQECNYTGSYTDLYDHYAIYTHQDSGKRCFREPYGVYVTISCIAPSSPEVGHFSYKISYVIADGHTMTYESPDVKKNLQVNLETLLENSMLIPHCSLSGDLLDLRLCIKKLN